MHLAKVVLTISLAVVVLGSAAQADIYNWQTGTVIDGTKGITPGPTVQLNSWNTASKNLKYAQFSGMDLSSAYLYGSWLDYADFSGANLTSANLSSATLANANFTNAVVAGANFGSATAFTSEQLASTASYRQKDLHGIVVHGMDLTGCDLAGQDLTGAVLGRTGQGNPFGWSPAVIAGADFTDAIVAGVDFSGTTLTQQQLYSTASYKNKNLAGIVFAYPYMFLYPPPVYGTGTAYSGNDLSGWNLSGQNLSGADLRNTNLTGANLTNANLATATLTNANFTNAVVDGAILGPAFSSTQLCQTANYKNKMLAGMNLSGISLRNWDASAQNLKGACLRGADLSWASFRGADLSGATLTNARLDYADLTNANFNAASLIHADLSATTMTGANYTSADLRGAWYGSLTGATRNTILSDGKIAGLNLLGGDTLTVRDYTVPITANTAMTMTSAATLKLIFSDATWGSTISPGAGVVPQLGGTLDLELETSDLATRRAMAGQTFTLFNWGQTLSSGNRFATILTPKGLVCDLSSLYTSGTVSFELAGDYNRDGQVNDADYTIWADNYRKTPPANCQRGDDASGGYDDADYTNWANNFTGDGVPVPEPASLSLLGMGLLGLLRRRKV